MNFNLYNKINVRPINVYAVKKAIEHIAKNYYRIEFNSFAMINESILIDNEASYTLINSLVTKTGLQKYISIPCFETRKITENTYKFISEPVFDFIFTSKDFEKYFLKETNISKFRGSYEHKNKQVVAKENALINYLFPQDEPIKH